MYALADDPTSKADRAAVRVLGKWDEPRAVETLLRPPGPASRAPGSASGCSAGAPLLPPLEPGIIDSRAMDAAAPTHLTFILCAPPYDDEPTLLGRLVPTLRPHFPGAAERVLPVDCDERIALRLSGDDDAIAFEGGSALPGAGFRAVVTLWAKDPWRRAPEGEPRDTAIEVITPATAGLIEAAPTILADLASTVSARWGFAEVGNLDEERRRPEDHGKLGLPELHEELLDGLPAALEWLNFWSAAACERLGIPASGPPLDTQGQQHARQVAGGWLLSLTREPLDLRNEEHLASLRRAYERFPEVGGVAEHRRHEQRLRTDTRELYDASLEALVRLLRSEINVAQLRHLNAGDVIVQRGEKISDARRQRWAELRVLWTTPAMASQQRMRVRAVDRAWEICRGEYLDSNPDQREVPEHVEAVIEVLRGEEIALEIAAGRRGAPTEA